MRSVSEYRIDQYLLILKSPISAPIRYRSDYWRKKCMHYSSVIFKHVCLSTKWHLKVYLFTSIWGHSPQATTLMVLLFISVELPLATVNTLNFYSVRIYQVNNYVTVSQQTPVLHAYGEKMKFNYTFVKLCML